MPILGLQSSSRKITSYGTINYESIETGFIETCDAWNTDLWSYTWNPPEVIDGEWIFNFPAGVEKNIQAVRLEEVGYGRYKVRFRTSGPRVPGTNYFVFLYHDDPLNELDIPELWGKDESTLLSICTWRDGVPDWWFFNSDEIWEDGVLHEWEFLYTAERIEFYLDGKLLFEYDEDPANPVLALPPMQFIIGGSGKGTSTEDFQFIIDELMYQSM